MNKETFQAGLNAVHKELYFERLDQVEIFLFNIKIIHNDELSG